MLATIVLLIIGLGAVGVLAQEAQEAIADEELIARYAKGELKAFEILYQRHRKPVFNFILRSVHSPERAEELVQEVFMRLVQNANGYVRDAKFTTWLYTIARNICIDSYRRTRNRQELSLQRSLGHDDQGGNTLEHMLEDAKAADASEKRVFEQQVKDVLEEGIALLPEEQREVFLLREASHLAYGEIASIVEVSENTVKSRMRYALSHLRKHMESKGFSPKDIAK